MKKNTVTNLVLGVVTILGIGYVIQKCVNTKNKVRVNGDKKINNKKDFNINRTYHTLYTTDVLSDNNVVESVNKTR